MPPLLWNKLSSSSPILLFNDMRGRLTEQVAGRLDWRKSKDKRRFAASPIGHR